MRLMKRMANIQVQSYSIPLMLDIEQNEQGPKCKNI